MSERGQPHDADPSDDKISVKRQRAECPSHKRIQERFYFASDLLWSLTRSWSLQLYTPPQLPSSHSPFPSIIAQENSCKYAYDSSSNIPRFIIGVQIISSINEGLRIRVCERPQLTLAQARPPAARESTSIGIFGRFSTLPTVLADQAHDLYQRYPGFH